MIEAAARGDPFAIDLVRPTVLRVARDALVDATQARLVANGVLTSLRRKHGLGRPRPGTNIPLQCPNAIFTVAGRTFTAPQAVTFLQTVLTAVAAAATAKAAEKTAETAAEEMMATDGAVAKGIRDTMGSGVLRSWSESWA